MAEQAEKEEVIDPCGPCGHSLDEHIRDMGGGKKGCSHAWGKKDECMCGNWQPRVKVTVKVNDQ